MLLKWLLVAAYYSYEKNVCCAMQYGCKLGGFFFNSDVCVCVSIYI